MRGTRSNFGRFGLSGLAIVAFCVLAVGCGEEPTDSGSDWMPAGSDDSTQEAHEGPVDQLLSASAAKVVFGHEGLWRLSPVIDAEDGATRVGFLIDVWEDTADSASLVMEARGILADGTETAWVPVEVTWNEHPYLVARADLGATALQAQFRVAEESLDQIAHVTWSAVLPEAESQATSADTAQAQGALSSTLSNIGVMSRAQWNAKATKCSAQDGAKTKFAVHHTVSATTSSGSYEKVLRAIQSYHMDTRGWCDVGYHFLVTTDGRVWEGRPLQYVGAHVSGHNSKNVGVSFVGCFHSSGCGAVGGSLKPPVAMLQGAGTVIGTLANTYGVAINSTTVKGHRDHSGTTTSCPGDYLHEQVDAIRTYAKGGSAPPVEPQPKLGRILGVIFDGSVTQSPSVAGNVRLPAATVSLDGGTPKAVSSGDAIWTFDAVPGTHEVTAAAPGYETYTRTVEVHAGQDTWGSIGLIPVAKDSTLVVAVVDKWSVDLQPLDQAIVHVEGAGARQVTSGGTATITLPQPSAVVHVYRDGYVAQTNIEVHVPAGTSETLYVALEPDVAPAQNTGALLGVVYDASVTSGPSDPGNVRVDTAIVTCGCGHAQWTKAGNAFWQFDAPAGPWRVTAIAPDYVEAGHDLVSSPGQDVWGSIGVIPAAK